MRIVEYEPSLTAAIVDATNRRDTIDAILSHLVDEELIPLEAVEAIRDGIERREALGTTAIGQGVAIPHVKHACAVRPLLAVALLTTPNTDWDSLDGEPVDLVFLIVAPPDPTKQYQAYFERLYRRVRTGFSDELRRCTSRVELLAAMKDFEDDRSS